MRGRDVITPFALVERIAQGWRPGSSRPRRRARQEPTAAAANAALAEQAAHRIVLDFREDGTVLRASVLRKPGSHPSNYPFAGPWPGGASPKPPPQVGG